jgi:hypothetical protein
LQAASSQVQQSPYLAEREPQALHTPYESQRFDITFPILSEATVCSRRFRQQGGTLVGANGVRSQANSLCQPANMHRPAPRFEIYTLEYSPESSPSFERRPFLLCGEPLLWCYWTGVTPECSSCAKEWENERQADYEAENPPGLEAAREEAARAQYLAEKRAEQAETDAFMTNVINEASHRLEAQGLPGFSAGKPTLALVCSWMSEENCNKFVEDFGGVWIPEVGIFEFPDGSQFDPKLNQVLRRRAGEEDEDA